MTADTDWPDDAEIRRHLEDELGTLLVQALRAADVGKPALEAVVAETRDRIMLLMEVYRRAHLGHTNAERRSPNA